MIEPSGITPDERTLGAHLFPLRKPVWGAVFVWPLAPGRNVARIADGRLQVKMGLLGSADVPLERIVRIGTMAWPWWGGVGVRLGRGLVAFVPSSGECALVELDEPWSVRAPLAWRTRRLVLGVEDVEGFVDALGAARSRLPSAG